MKGALIIAVLCGSVIGVVLIMTTLIAFRYMQHKSRQDLKQKTMDKQKRRIGIIGPHPLIPTSSPLGTQYSSSRDESSSIGKTQDVKRFVLGSSLGGDISWVSAATTEESDVWNEDDYDEKESSGSDDGVDETAPGFKSIAATTKPSINYCLSFESSTMTLRVDVNRVTNLPMRFRKHCSSFVKLAIIGSRKKTALYTNIVHKTLNPEYNESFTFKISDSKELEDEQLRLSVYIRHRLKDKFIGDFRHRLESSALSAGPPTPFVNQLESKVKKKSKKHGSLNVNQDLGQLFVLIQYQSDANRIKILIRKAENLPKLTGKIGQRDHYIILHLMKDNVPITYKETKSAGGTNPVWNEPFLFDIPSNEDINNFWLQFLVMRGRYSTKDDIVGHVLIGHQTTSSGSAHWNETLLPRCREIARWHMILPFT